MVRALLLATYQGVHRPMSMVYIDPTCFPSLQQCYLGDRYRLFRCIGRQGGLRGQTSLSLRVLENQGFRHGHGK